MVVVVVDALAGAGSRRALAAAACLAFLVACSPAPEAPDEGSSGLEASASRTRDDDNLGGQFQTRLANIGDTAIDIVSVALDSPGFDAAAARSRAVELGPGNRIDIPTEYGRVRCGSAPTPASVTVELADGRTISVPLNTPYDVLDTIAREECAAEDVRRAVELALVPLQDTETSTLRAELTVRRLATIEPVRVDDIRGSVLYGLTAALPIALAVDSESMTVPIDITAATCAAHAIADSKKPFVFPVFLAFGDTDPVYARIPVSPDAQASLIAFQTRVCSSPR